MRWGVQGSQNNEVGVQGSQNNEVGVQGSQNNEVGVQGSQNNEVVVQESLNRLSADYSNWYRYQHTTHANARFMPIGINQYISSRLNPQDLE